MYGHDLSGTRASEDKTFTVQNVSKLERKWEVWLPSCTSTPAVVDNKVFVGDWFGHVHAFEAQHGRSLWSRKVSSSSIDDSPLIAKGKLYVGDGVGRLHALDASSGAQLWTAQVDAHPSAHVYSSPILIDDLILIGSSSLELIVSQPDYTFRGSIVAFDARTGAERWRTYVAFDDGVQSGAGVSVWSSFVVDKRRGLAFIGTGQTYERPVSRYADSLLAVEYRTGKIRWHRQFTEDDIFVLNGQSPGPDHDIGAHPNLFRAGGVDAVGVGDKSGKYGAFDRDTGRPLWNPEFIKVSNGGLQGGFMDSAAYNDGVLYMASNHRLIFIDGPQDTDLHILQAVNAQTGATLWRHEKQYPSVGGLAYANGVVFNISTDASIYAVDASTGEELWRDGMSTVDPRTGERKQKLAASGPSIAAGRVFACQGFAFFKTAGENTIHGGLIAYGLPDLEPPSDAGPGGPDACIDTTCQTAAGRAECKAASIEEGTCAAGAECACNSCACELDACRDDPDCSAIRECILETGCFQGTMVTCYQPQTCMAVASAHGGAQGPGVLRAVAALACERDNRCAAACPAP